MRLQLKQSWGREDSPAWKLFPLVPGCRGELLAGPPALLAGPHHRTEPSGAGPGGGRAASPPALGNGSTFSGPGPARGPQGPRGRRPSRSRRLPGRARFPQPGRGRAGGRRCRARGAGRGAGGGARGVRGRGGVQLSLALLVVTARQAHIPSGSRSLSPFCFPTIELRWKQKIEGV